MATLYPEIRDYIYYYCEKFMTSDEAMAKQTMMYSLKTNSPAMRARMLEQKWISDDPKILSMIADGHEALKERIVDRIWKDHQFELELNFCPACKRIARTPTAKQCRFCSHDWH
ncbi:hypothetical protein [Chitinophaga pinensis]|uniref:Uncharacterized protein n=1 Tax=Chitinophaga pinensis (strain ATCC 43595 / DSM 2588 / LMG 13176 / NBRC 15968 / NCIMB 11800 / UQM 2034) TaxID=485918 RepID=A0A979G4Y5_CHIPD|nr:hypothetical protein [Chitinophaga pinensis]ACU60944.1 hypothetical protein Cpin_3477 [Chitinophaga pinensis DSM 2588]